MSNNISLEVLKELHDKNKNLSVSFIQYLHNIEQEIEPNIFEVLDYFIEFVKAKDLDKEKSYTLQYLKQMRSVSAKLYSLKLNANQINGLTPYDSIENTLSGNDALVYRVYESLLKETTLEIDPFLYMLQNTVVLDIALDIVRGVMEQESKENYQNLENLIYSAQELNLLSKYKRTINRQLIKITKSIDVNVWREVSEHITNQVDYLNESGITRTPKKEYQTFADLLQNVDNKDTFAEALKKEFTEQLRGQSKAAFIHALKENNLIKSASFVDLYDLMKAHFNNVTGDSTGISRYIYPDYTIKDKSIEPKAIEYAQRIKKLR